MSELGLKFRITAEPHIKWHLYFRFLDTGPGKNDNLPGGLVSFDFLLTGYFEFLLSLFLDSQDTSEFVPGRKS